MGGGHPQLIFQQGRGDREVAPIDVVDEDGECEQGEHLPQRSRQLLDVGRGVCSHKRAPSSDEIYLYLSDSLLFIPHQLRAM